MRLSPGVVCKRLRNYLTHFISQRHNFIFMKKIKENKKVRSLELFFYENHLCLVQGFSGILPDLQKCNSSIFKNSI
ncbi:hypothetical protein BpHYR1_013338 [Brachionus plicatilis]|uniref:Uncharacterized protein n=1 Tax=Brachionus plicatilis TaxID=10195 RepID=A0A3M7QWQ2_BRAPC|nr:hypothetical protein BpHYR1_013338 [Brachionus plicatilis]